MRKRERERESRLCGKFVESDLLFTVERFSAAVDETLFLESGEINLIFDAF